MSGVSNKQLKAYARTIDSERKAQSVEHNTYLLAIAAAMRPFVEFQKKGFWQRLRWLVTGR